MQGHTTAGVAQIREGLAEQRRVGHELGRPHRLALLAEAYGQAGQPEAGLAVLAEGLTLVAATEERWWEAEVYRLQAALLLQSPRPDVGQAEAALYQALDVARKQQARVFELRAALSLGRLWQQQDKGAEAHALLAEVYGWFTEGLTPWTCGKPGRS
jgi:predicted ATPase